MQLQTLQLQVLQAPQGSKGLQESCHSVWGGRVDKAGSRRHRQQVTPDHLKVLKLRQAAQRSCREPAGLQLEAAQSAELWRLHNPQGRLAMSAGLNRIGSLLSNTSRRLRLAGK